MGDSVLLLLDYINDIVHERGKLGAGGYAAQVAERDVLKRVNQMADKARSEGIPVIWVRVGFSMDYRECPEGSLLFGAAREYSALQLETWATEIHSDLHVAEGDFMITKHRVSAFYATPLEAILRTLSARRVFLGGVATDLVVQTTAREAHDRDYTVVVLEDICAAANAQEHENTIATLAKIAQIGTTVAIDSHL